MVQKLVLRIGGNLLHILRSLGRDCSGGTTIEKTFLASLLAIVVVAVADDVGTLVVGTYEQTQEKILNATPGNSGDNRNSGNSGGGKKNNHGGDDDDDDQGDDDDDQDDDDQGEDQ